ncbi:transcriptional regulator [Kaistia algarum]|uniref:IclR family transcriptional regulator n=1 Tax=Kaistia algarum TaxID=2083279 RepID=UPI000CE90C6F|nr:IclR family transcriptional regulator [Kaistia algarum]MCX5513947.1 IclR family transcriptional regulator [Kaistia algarum]PPE78077.1 transcriptional regulator [Kaistia algarum]
MVSRTPKAEGRPAKSRAAKVAAAADGAPIAGTAKPAYSAPALEKGLDVLELLASLSEGVTPSQIAQRLGRSLQEVYRVVVALERRGYIRRAFGEESLVLSTKLHDLAYGYPPLRRLVEAAQPILKHLAIEAYQAVHLAVLDGLMIRVVAQVDSPAPLGFRLRVGTQNPAARTASGRLLIAFQRPAMQDWLYGAIGEASGEAALGHLKARIEAVHAHGYEMIEGEQLKGITDVSFPILDADGYAPAVLTMPFLSSAAETVPIETASRMLFEAAARITEGFGGRLGEPRFPLESSEEAMASRSRARKSDDP